jgi:hypothetical protein
VAPISWPSAGLPPYLNIVGEDPQLRDPEHGDYRPQPGSPALGYGCQTFPPAAALARPDSPAGARDDGGARRSAAFASARGASRPSRLPAPPAITTDTLWDADTVAVDGDLLIESGVTLAIAPGVRVEFSGPYKLSVAGRLLAIGTPEERIVFTSARPELFAVDSTATGCWHGLHFEGTPAASGRSCLEFCVLEYAKGAGGGARGGALTVVGFSNLRVADCIFRHNVADYGAALFCSQYAAPVLTGNLMTGNTAFVGGAAVFDMDAYPKLVANTIVGNPVVNPDIFVATGVIHNYIAKALTTGNILWDNPNHYFEPGQIREGKVYYVTFNDIALGHAGEGNFDADPLFADQGADPYALGDGSPCVNAGVADTLGLGLPALDLAGEGRIYWGRADAGAYEWRPVSAVPEASPAVRLRLLPVGPNPSRGETRVRFELAAASRVTLTIHDAAGRSIARVFDATLGAGEHEIAWDGRDGRGRATPAGIYYGRLRSGGIERIASLVRLSSR